TCSPDGKWVYYFGGITLKRIPIDGGKSESVPGSDIRNSFFGESPLLHGDFLFFIDLLSDPTTSSVTKIASVDLHPGAQGSPRLIDVNPAITSKQYGWGGIALRLTPDMRALAYPITTKGVDNIWAQPLDGSSGYQITNYSSGQI